MRREDEKQGDCKHVQHRRTGKAQRVVASWQRARGGTRLLEAADKKPFTASGYFHGIRLPSERDFSGQDDFDRRVGWGK